MAGVQEKRTETGRFEPSCLTHIFWQDRMFSVIFRFPFCRCLVLIVFMRSFVVIELHISVYCHFEFFFLS